ncbi:glycoside hydrolase family 125 protein, partial [Phascolarctobacterium faecium]|uniref:glycoside hydrolase family 125 protein n=1 Tax=Phascolarctobacterium faecium TaxID=33025 RepID=UPI001D082F50
PYLPIAKDDTDLADMIAGLVKRQFFYINIDPYANAFNEEPNNAGHQTDHTEINPWIWERKYEIDSLCYPVQ